MGVGFRGLGAWGAKALRLGVSHGKSFSLFWIVVMELNLSYHIGQVLLIAVYTHYGNLI